MDSRQEIAGMTFFLFRGVTFFCPHAGGRGGGKFESFILTTVSSYGMIYDVISDRVSANEGKMD